MPRQTRTTIVPCIYQDNHGYEMIVSRNGRTFRKRYPRTKTVGWLKNELQRQIEKLARKGPRNGVGALAGDVNLYLRTLPEGRAKADREQWLTAWTTLGHLSRDQITPQMVRETMAGWRVGDKEKDRAPGASTMNHRRHALRALYKALDGEDAPTPCDNIKRAVERREIRVVPRGVALAIIRQMHTSKSAARIKILARTGLPHAQIGRLKPEDVDLDARVMRVTPRRKGAGTQARTLPLTYAAVRAFKQFARLDAWGPFSSQSLYKTFQEAVIRAKDRWRGRWPVGHVRPYDLRHAYLTEVYRRTGDLRATAELAMHADMSMTARYADAAVSATSIAARDAMDRRPHDGTRRKRASRQE